MRLTSLLLLIASLAILLHLPAQGGDQPLHLSSGPHLFIDDYFIAAGRGLTRTTHHPRKLAQPVLVGTPPYNEGVGLITIARDPQRNVYRMWYGANYGIPGPFSQYGYAESHDAIAWSKPALNFQGQADNNLLKVKRGFGLFVTDAVPTTGFAGGLPRYKLAHFSYGGDEASTGMWVEFSSDGLQFTPHDANPVLKFTEQPGDVSVSDIIDGCWDPIRERYIVCHKTIGYPTDGYRGSTPNVNEGHRRMVGQSISTDFINWTPPRRIVMPDPAEPGVWEFLGMKPFVRGQLFIGLLRILRDDLPLDPNSPGHGIGWTELCTSRDGENWTWHHKPYLDRSADHPDAQDHASAYASECITVGDQDYIYFAASRGGHKTNSSVLALAKQPKNRFVSRDAGDTAAVLLTPLLVLNARTMTLNADVRGRLNVRLLNEDDQPIAGFETPSNEPIAGDSLAHKVNFPKSITTLAARPVRIEFTLQNASVFGFDLEK